MTVEVIAADWPARAVAGTTTRTGGVSAGPFRSLNLAAHVGDVPDNVAENRRRFTTACGLPTAPFWIEQVHGCEVAFADDHDPDAPPPTADASVSRSGRHVLTVLTADCLPVVLSSASSAELAVAHCGWRSLSGGIIHATVNAMATPADELVAWLGPAISQPAFEVGDDVRDLFLAGVEGAAGCFEPNDNGRWQADIYALARLHLSAAGVRQVTGGGLCTVADQARFFSYRRDGRCGRMATFVFAP